MTRDRRSQKRIIVYQAEVPNDPEPYEVVYESVADALHFACRDLRTDRRRPVAILEDGLVVMDAQGIAEACQEREESEPHVPLEPAPSEPD